jgi:uncharacterized protein DUF1553/uncharacterized protein DUF1549/cytochrome c
MNAASPSIRALVAVSLAGLAVALPIWADSAPLAGPELVAPASLDAIATPAAAPAATPADAIASLATSPNAAVAASGEPGEPSEKVLFGRDIRPILSDRCFQCHGPDVSTREADLRLDALEFATADLGGYAAIVPGDLDASELWYRLTTTRKGDAMPPHDSKVRPLNEEQKLLFKHWIEQGAEYEPHWAFQPPMRPPLPAISASSWPRNPIDHYILAGIENADLTPSPEADPATLVRRVFLDLTGLPPTPDELDAFLADPQPDAYERLVDRLLTEEPYVSRYAERMATPWLDAARYADTNGIHMDAGRQMWAWRDWVLRALRDNQPFDQFVLEQLSGDLIPEATLQQKVASGFNRNHVITDEGGAINEEYLVEYAADRTATTGAVFLGLTLQCARCHDHKFDPISQQEYYSMFAYFNSNEEPGLYSQLQNSNRAFEPFMQVPSDAQKSEQAELSVQLTALKAEMEQPSSADAQAYDAFLASAAETYGTDWAASEVVRATATAGSTMTILDDQSILASGENPDKENHTVTLRTDKTGLRLLLLEALQDESHFEQRVGRAPNGNAVLSYIEAVATSVADPTQQQTLNLAWAWADLEQSNADFDVVNALDPNPARVWAVDAHGVKGGRNAIFLTDQPYGFEGGTELQITFHYQSGYTQHVFGRVRLTPGTISEAGLAALPVADSRWYGTWPYNPSEQGPGYDQVFGPEADPTIDFAKKYPPDDYSWVFVPQIKDAVVNNVLPAGQKVSFVGRRLFAPSARELELSLGSDDGLQVFLDGEMVFENRVNRGAAADQERIKLGLSAGLHTVVLKVVNTGGPGGVYWKALPPADELADALVWSLAPPQVRELGANDLAQRVSSIWRTQHSPAYREKLAQAESLQTELSAIEAAIPLTMIMKELAEPRPTFVLMRGAYDLPNKQRPVTRAVPAVLGSLPENAPNDRYGLAQWLIADDNPLLARVTVNRMWAMIFGTGIVQTVEDFGYQGAWPSHPELLDWLAVEFRESGWDVKAMIKGLVTSSTYRQQTRLRPEAGAADPQNLLLSSYPRRRLGAEEIRDQALYVSDLLVEQFGGPSVKPYQPDGLWKEVAMPSSNTRNFVLGEGQQLWRRSLYTYWKRAVPPPSLLTLDAPTREFCTLNRGTTNTPLQALVLWNDEQFVEAARLLAQRTLAEEISLATKGEIVQDADDRRIARMFRRCTGRTADAAELARLHQALDVFLARYQAAPDDAAKLLEVGQAMLPSDFDAVRLAAWTMLGNALLALDETITHH